MLIPEKEAFLLWLSQKETSIPARVMREQNAPHYTSDRLRNLVKAGLVDQALGIDEIADDTSGFYAITDEGRRSLQQMQQRREDRAAEIADHRRNHTVQIATAIISATLGSLLTLLLEHFDGIIQALSSLLGH